MDLSAFQLNKNNPRTNFNSRLHETPIVHYGRVIRIIDVQTVIVETVIQVSLAKEVYTVTLLNLSSALLELSAWPKVGDTVLLLFLQRHDPRMFVQETVNNSNAVGYNKFSGVGILASTVKGFARTVLQFYEGEGKPAAEMRSAAKWLATFNAELTLTFCRMFFNDEDEALISITFGEGRPYMQQFLSTAAKEHGFWKNSENELVELDAAVAEKYSIYAPITKDIQGSQTINIGLSRDKDDNPIETEAPVTEVVHGKAPITRDIRSPQNITIGIGNDETGNAEEQREAPVGIELGENADIAISSKSGLAAAFKKGVTLKTGSAELIEISNAVASLGSLVSELTDLVTELNALVTNLDTVGSPAGHSTGPVAKPQLAALDGKLAAFKNKWEQVFK